MAFSEQGDEWEDMLGGGQEESNPFSTEEVTHTNAPGHTPHPLFDSPPAGNAPGVVSQSPNPFQSPLEVAASQNIANPLDPLQVTTPTSSSPQPSPFPPALSTPSTPQPSPSPSPASSPAPLPSSSPVAFPSSSPLGESKFQFQILEPEKIGDGMGGFVSYPITCTSTAPGWTKEEMKTARRYSEFLWLFDQLLHFDRCAIVPPLPEKVVTLSKYDKTFLKHRQTELDRFLDRVGGHPSLSLCPALKTFMTKETLQSPSANTKASSSGGGWFSFLGDTISTISGSGTKPTEPDPYFETKGKLYADLETLTLSLADTSSSYLSTYSEKSSIFSKFAELCRELSQKEEGGDQRIAASFLRLSDIGAQLADLHGGLGDSLKEFWENDIRDQYRYIIQVRVMLQYRSDLLASAHIASNELKMKQEKLERMPMSHPDYPGFKSSIGALEENEQKAKQAFDEASQKCREELNLFEACRVLEIRNLAVLFARSHLNHLLNEGNMWRGLLSDLQD